MLLENIEKEINEIKSELIKLEHSKKNFSDFNDYLNPLLDIDLKIKLVKIKTTNKELEFSFYDSNKGFNTYFSTHAIFNIFIGDDKLNFHSDFKCYSKNKVHIKKQVETFTALSDFFDKVEFLVLNSLFEKYINLNNSIKKLKQKLTKLQTKYYDLSYGMDKKAIENNLIKVSNEENKNKIKKWFSERTLFNSFFITYHYKKNEIWFEKIIISSRINNKNEHFIDVDGKSVSEKQLLKILNNTFYIDNEIVYNYDFLKDKKPSSGFDIEFDIKEFAKLFVIKDKIKDF